MGIFPDFRGENKNKPPPSYTYIIYSFLFFPPLKPYLFFTPTLRPSVLRRILHLFMTMDPTHRQHGHVHRERPTWEPPFLVSVVKGWPCGTWETFRWCWWCCCCCCCRCCCCCCCCCCCWALFLLRWVSWHMFPFKKNLKWASFCPLIHRSANRTPSLRFPYSTSLFAPRRNDARREFRHTEKVKQKKKAQKGPVKLLSQVPGWFSKYITLFDRDSKSGWCWLTNNPLIRPTISSWWLN